MSSFLDKLRTLINAQLRGPRQKGPGQAQAVEQPPSAPGKIPEVSEGRRPKAAVEVSQVRPKALEGEASPPPSTPSRRRLSESDAPPDDLDEGRVADMVKKQDQ